MFQLLAQDFLIGQRTGWARDHALPARDAGRASHRHVGIEGDCGRVALALTSNDKVVANLRTPADAAIAQDTGGVIHHDAQRRFIFRMGRRESFRESWSADAVALSECFEFAIA